MRNSLLVLLSCISLCLKVNAQTTPPIMVAPGEYQIFLYHTSDRILYAIGGALGTQGVGANQTQQAGTIMKVQFPGAVQMKTVSSGLHSGLGVGQTGRSAAPGRIIRCKSQRISMETSSIM
jgi:hypothetical protein